MEDQSALSDHLTKELYLQMVRFVHEIVFDFRWIGKRFNRQGI